MAEEKLILKDFHEARERIQDSIHGTPMESATFLGQRTGAGLFLKCENLQKTGSFKVRGTLNKALLIKAAGESRGLVTVSAGNLAQALAWASRTADIPCTVVMPANASKTKLDACRGYGAEIVPVDDVLKIFEKGKEVAQRQERTFIHPFDDIEIIAGHGSVGLEILDQTEGVDIIVVGIGGGGLISGIAAAVKLTNPKVRIFGVEPVGAACMRKSLDTGKVHYLDSIDTIADGLAPPMAGENTLEFVKKYVEDVVLVTDEEIIEAMSLVLSRCKLLTEPAGCATVAALLNGRIPCSENDRVVAVLSGGNIDIQRLKELV